MSSDPRSTGGWYPRLNRTAEHCLSTWIGDPDPVTGVRPTASIVDGHVVVEDGYAGDWLNDTTIVVTNQKTGRLVTWTIGDTAPRLLQSPLASMGANVVVASNNVLAVSVSPSGQPPRTYLQYGADIGEYIGYAQPALSESSQHYAYLGETGNVYFQGNLVDERTCANPEFGGETLAYEYDAKIAGFTTLGQPRTELTVPGVRQWKPVPVWTGSRLVVLAFSATPDRPGQPGKGFLTLQDWKDTSDPSQPVPGWPVFDGIDDGPHHARAIDQTHVAIAFNVGGVLQRRVIDLDSPTIDLRTLAASAPAPDVPFRVDPNASFDLSDWLQSCTAQQGEIYWWRKNAPVFGKPWGAWMRLVDGLIGLLADSSTGQFLVNDQIDAMYFAGPYLWAPLKGQSGWHAEYVTDFIWDSHVDRAIPVKVGMECGYGRFGGIETHRRHWYDPRRPDPKNPKRKTGFLEYAYIGDDGVEFRFEEHQDDENGVLVLHRAIQPTPHTGKEAFVAPLRPQPYPPVEGDEMNPPGVTIDSYDKVIRPGQPWKLVMHDRGSGLQVTVELRDGGVWGSMKNAAGEDHSSSFRPVAVQP